MIKLLQSVPIVITRHLAYGLAVETQDGQKGIIRVREISWDSKERDNWQNVYPVGTKTIAVVLKDEDNQLEFSIKLAKKDPWKDISSRFKRGEIASGIVTGVVSYGAFVQLDDTISGLLHVSNLPPRLENTPLELFWPGDHILVKIDEIDFKRRRIQLSLVEFPANLEEKSHIKASLLTDEQSNNGLGLFRLEEFIQKHKIRKSIVVIEDDPAQAQMVSTWLSKIGQDVFTAENGTDGLEQIERIRPDVALVDLRLPDLLGISVIRKALEIHPDIRCILMTDWSHADEYSSEINQLYGSGVRQLLKPVLPDEIIEMLVKIDDDRSTQSKQFFSDSYQNNFQLNIYNQRILNESLHEILEQCRLQTGFEACFLFKIDPVQRSVEIIQKTGVSAFQRTSLPSLIYSPVQDAAEDGEIIILEKMEDHHLPRFRYLHEFFPFSSCIGSPVPARITQKYSLFLLDPNPKTIGAEVQLFIQGLALSAGVLLEKFALQEQTVSLQRTALLGHLTRGLVHEINHQLGVLHGSAFNLDNQITKMGDRSIPEVETAKRLDAAKKTLQILNKAIKSITNTTKQFGHILTRPKEELLRIDEIVEGAIHLVSDLGDRNKVRIIWEPPDELLVIRGQGTSLEQVVVNLLLNAIQQIGEYRPTTGGWVRIIVSLYTEASQSKMLRIRIEDNGPGIHLRQWEEVFEPGYTTREDGSGMGLYISRSLMESMGGNIKVENSYILSGSSFLVELPWQI